jgi:hypothetical protein
VVDALVLLSKLRSKARCGYIGTVGLERVVERIKVFVWLLSNALEAIVIIKLILVI